MKEYIKKALEEGKDVAIDPSSSKRQEDFNPSVGSVSTDFGKNFLGHRFMIVESSTRSLLALWVNHLIKQGYRKISAVRCPRTSTDNYWCEMVLETKNCPESKEEACPVMSAKEEVPSSNRLDIYIHFGDGGKA